MKLGYTVLIEDSRLNTLCRSSRRLSQGGVQRICDEFAITAILAALCSVEALAWYRLHFNNHTNSHPNRQKVNKKQEKLFCNCNSVVTVFQAVDTGGSIHSIHSSASSRTLFLYFGVLLSPNRNMFRTVSYRLIFRDKMYRSVVSEVLNDLQGTLLLLGHVRLVHPVCLHWQSPEPASSSRSRASCTSTVQGAQSVPPPEVLAEVPLEELLEEPLEGPLEERLEEPLEEPLYVSTFVWCPIPVTSDPAR